MQPLTVLYKQFIIFFSLLALSFAGITQPVFLLNSKNSPVLIQKEQVPWWGNNDTLRTCRFLLVNKSGFDKEYLIRTPRVANLYCWSATTSEPAWKFSQSGSLLALNDRTLPSGTIGTVVLIRNNDTAHLIIRFHSRFAIYSQIDYSLTVQPLVSFEKSDSNRLLWQGLFLGIILVMALYNLIIFFAVKDLSYLYYVLSIVGIGFYLSFYYGITIEYIWPNAPRWDLFFFTIVVPFNGLTRILFTRTYLQTAALLPQLNKVLNLLGLLSGLCMASGFIAYLFSIDIINSATYIVGILGTLILIMMLLSGLAAYYVCKYEPAQYFIYANLLLVIGGILFILREVRLIPDTFVTRYFVQIATLIQVVVFALGLASRLNQTRSLLTKEILERERLTLEKEIEKKALIEKQKEELQIQVDQQTRDLKEQNHQLEDYITKLKASELKLTELNQLKDKLFSIISHDLRNPLATMQSTLKLITEHHNKLDEAERDKLQSEAQISLNNLNQLLYNLLQWSRSQMNLMQFKPEKLNLHNLLENCLQVVRLNAHTKNIRIHIVAGNDLYAFADRDMLEFIVRNLLNNAIKFSYRDSDVYVKASAQGKGIRVEVLDSGIGISPNKIQKLLQINASITRRGTEKEKGTGLGLLICKDFVERNNGELKIESEPGKGSNFSFTLPGADLRV